LHSHLNSCIATEKAATPSIVNFSQVPCTSIKMDRANLRNFLYACLFVLGFLDANLAAHNPRHTLPKYCPTSTAPSGICMRQHESVGCVAPSVSSAMQTHREDSQAHCGLWPRT
jgi:hypothetical protein